MDDVKRYFFEAERIGSYLLGVSIEKSEKYTYAIAMLKLNIEFSKYEQFLWKEMFKSKWKMSCIDAGLSFSEPTNNVRRKLFTMLAILEASPNYTSFFLSRNFSPFYFFKICLIGARSIVRLFFGIIIINIIKRQCN